MGTKPRAKQRSATVNKLLLAELRALHQKARRRGSIDVESETIKYDQLVQKYLRRGVSIQEIIHTLRCDSKESKERLNKMLRAMPTTVVSVDGQKFALKGNPLRPDVIIPIKHTARR